MAGALLWSRTSELPRSGRPAEGPETPWFEGIGATFRSNEDDFSIRQDIRLLEQYKAIEQALIEQGADPSAWRKGWIEGLFSRGTRLETVVDPDAIWAEIGKARNRDPGAFSSLPKTREEYDEAVLNRFGESDRDEGKASRAHWSARLVGGIASGIEDPLTIASSIAGIGPARSIGQAILRESVINGAVSVVAQPQIKANRERRGKDYTAEDAALNIGADILFGAIVGGATKGIGDNWDSIKSLTAPVQEGIWAQIAPHLPEKMRGKMDWDALDDQLPDLAEAMIGADSLTPDERAAIGALRRDAEIAAINPYVRNGPGLQAHAEGMAEAMQAILDAQPAKAAVRTTPAALRSGTAIRTGNADLGGRASLKRRIGRVESGGNNAARNPNSSAMGTYQFIKATWVSLYKRRYGAGGLTDEQIAARRADPRLQEVLMDDLIDHNARMLARAGIDESAGNLYLAHFAGPNAAISILRADRKTPISRLVTPEAIRANRSVLEGRTAGDVVDWAHGKMNSRPDPAGYGRGEASDDLDRALADEIAAIDERLGDLDDELAGALEPEPMVRGEPIDEGIEPQMSDELDIAMPVRPIEPDGPLLTGDPAPVQVRNGDAMPPREVIGPVILDVDPKDWPDVVLRLAAEQTGEVRGALNNPAIGAIDVIWGQAGTRASDGWGLAKLIEHHPEVVERLPDIVEALPVVQQSANRFRLEDDRYRAVVRRDFDGAEKTWLLTAFERKKPSPGTEDGRVPGNDPDASPDADGAGDIVQSRRAGKGGGRGAAAEPGGKGRGDGWGAEEDSGPIDQAAYGDFEDPDGDGMAAVADSLDHDLDEEAGGGFRVEEEGGTMSAAQIRAEIEAEAQLIEAIKGCL